VVFLRVLLGVEEVEMREVRFIAMVLMVVRRRC
jgi:hypothetical protein